jgi:hypothetical protein
MPDWHKYNGGVGGDGWQQRRAPEDCYFVFSAVRNPFDRVISAWKYLPFLQSLPLEFVLRNLPRTGHDFRHITVQQADMLVDANTQKLVTNALIRYENLQSDFDRVCRLIGKPVSALPFVNRSDRSRDYREYYNAITRRLVEELFHKDIETFGYSF